MKVFIFFWLQKKYMSLLEKYRKSIEEDTRFLPLSAEDWLTPCQFPLCDSQEH